GSSKLLEEPANFVYWHSTPFGGSHARLPPKSAGVRVRWSWLGLFCRRGSRRLLLGCFPAAPAEQRQGILGIKGELANGLFTGCAESDVHAAVVGHAHG